MKGSDAFRAMVGGHKIRRASWPEGCTWSANLEDRDCSPIITGPPAWVRRCYNDHRWCMYQWRGYDWEVAE